MLFPVFSILTLHRWFFSALGGGCCFEEVQIIQKQCETGLEDWECSHSCCCTWYVFVADFTYLLFSACYWPMGLYSTVYCCTLWIYVGCLTYWCIPTILLAVFSYYDNNSTLKENKFSWELIGRKLLCCMFPSFFIGTQQIPVSWLTEASVFEPC